MKDPEISGSDAREQHHNDPDGVILHRVREMFKAADPMPEGIVDRIRFSLACHDLGVELARLLAEEGHQVPAARGTEHSRTVTFDSDSLTIMIRIDSDHEATARVDGWLLPAQRRTIDLRTGTQTLTAVADDGGRFAFTQVPHGSAQFVVRAEPGTPGSGQVVMTPVLIL